MLSNFSLIFPKIAKIAQPKILPEFEQFCAGSKPIRYSQHRATRHMLPLLANTCESPCTRRSRPRYQDQAAKVEPFLKDLRPAQRDVYSCALQFFARFARGWSQNIQHAGQTFYFDALRAQVLHDLALKVA